MHISLLNLPRYEIHRPPLSLAILSQLCTNAGVEHDCWDFSLEIWQDLQHHWADIDTFCITGRLDSDIRSTLQAWVDQRIDDLATRNPGTVFAISLLSTWSLPMANIVIESIKRYGNRVLIGGQGLADRAWTETMHKSGLVDDYIVGEGEITFAAWLKGERDRPGLNNYNFQQIDDLDQHCVIPDYRRLLDRYSYPYIDSQPDLFITASRGCVRRCGYCDIGHQWKKYRYRSARHVADEMIAQYERHGIRNFFFTDSLINGSMKMLDELCDHLIKYQQQDPEAQFVWRGQYIFRPRDQVKPEAIAKMKHAGLDYVIVGLETGSDRVRMDMDKKHTNDDAEYFFEQFRINGIKCHLLMITGWVTETLQDHNDTLAIFPRWQRYVASGTITGIELGSTLTILEHSPVGHRSQALGIELLGNRPYLWTSRSNPDLTIHERVRRRVETHRVAMQYRWPITRSLYRLATIRNNFLEAVELLETGATKTRPITPLIVETA